MIDKRICSFCGLSGKEYSNKQNGKPCSWCRDCARKVSSATAKANSRLRNLHQTEYRRLLAEERERIGLPIKSRLGTKLLSSKVSKTMKEIVDCVQAAREPLSCKEIAETVGIGTSLAGYRILQLIQLDVLKTLHRSRDKGGYRYELSNVLFITQSESE